MNLSVFTRRADAHLDPAYDFLTTSVYAGYQHNPPGISFLGKKTWAPGKTLSRFIATTFGIAPKVQSVMLESICDAMAEVVPEVRARMEDLPAFRETGKRMLLAWKDGVVGLRDKQVYALSEMPASATFEGISAPTKLPKTHAVIGRSPLLGGRERS
jgi:serine/threonine-protein kinase HipA